ncbi:Frag1/DRAM/Sfk1 family-domain-containing protein [Hygrophoropsis aurantiaca]|uniref:Frag1/DRAM/Sfk1 family-domain-containing protein n=1 Tax=Hygrophoropsis aurantiaca TaxID=72124 RepID=A0ACB8AFT1_9AGAM|nr:Frag1/DRAM/Sfk1 family-domain-containing protein [Hygrophoropsis aurantiaca]
MASPRNKPKLSDKPNGKLERIIIDASHVAVVHTYLALFAFGAALILGCSLHYTKIVKNDVAGYPQEWFPSVSATIGDWYPERSIFHILIALTSGPRFALVSMQYFLNRSKQTSLSGLIFTAGIVRTLSCGGWVYITSNDDHDAHDVLMVVYIICNVPWMLGTIMHSHGKARARRRIIATAFYASILPLIYFFIQHKVHRVPGAYTRYSFFEWSLILFDILFDSVAEMDFKESTLQIAIGSSLGRSDKMPATLHDINGFPEPGTKQKEVLTNVEVPLATSNDVSKAAQRPNVWISVLQLALSPEWRSSTTFISDVYLSYIFWSIFTSLIPTLFYFSVWELGISGQELALLVLLSPLLNGIPPLRAWACTRGGRITLHALSLAGITAYALDDPLHRLGAVSFANVVLFVGRTAEWAGGKDGYQGVIMGLGLILSSLSKHANHSNNPVWPMVNEELGGYNKTGILLAICALIELYTRPPMSPTPTAQAENTPKEIISKPKANSWLSASLALGSLLFTLHCLLSDSSTIIAWSWSGYDNGHPKGPLPHLYGSVTLIAQAAGLLTCMILPATAVTHPLWFLYGSTSAYVMYRHRDWLGFAGGLNTVVFFMSIIPTVMSNAASEEKVGRTYFVASLVVIILYLANVWTVAYAFVPGGAYLRERTDLVLLAQFLALAPAFKWSFKITHNTPLHLPSSIKQRTYALLSLLSLSSVLISLYKWPILGPTPYKVGTRIFNAGIWTVHFGIDNVGHDSQRRIRDVIRDMQLDVVGLLETDLHRTVYGNRDLTRVIVEELGYYVDLGPGPNMHTWGAALLSKFPIISSHHHLLPSPNGELAPAIEAVLNIYGTEVTVVVSHNGQEEDPLDRELQSRELARIMAESYPKPVVFLGYVVTKPGASRPAPYDILVNDGRVHDIDPHDLDRWCEYVMYRGLYRTAYARVSRGIVTDTELQIGQFVLPKHGSGITNETEEARMLRSWKEELPEDHWFPMEYYGDDNEGGVNGHFYHVFNTPLYYKLPEGAVV